jgi:hypothetical protein
MRTRPGYHLKAAPLYAVLLLMGLLASLVSQAQTASDACGYDVGNEYPVDNSCEFRTFNKPSTFTSFTTPANCSGTNNNDAWGWFTATGTSTTITFDPDSDHRPIIHLFTGTCGSLTQVACNNSGSTGTNAQVVANTTPGTTYLVRIQRHASSNGMNGRICIWSPPSTDACSLEPATQVPVGSSCVFRPFTKPAAYNASMNPGGCSSGNYDDAWGSFIATGTTTSITYDPDNDHRPILHVFTGSCGSLSQVGCVNAGSTGTNANLTITTVVGQTYYFRIQRHNTNDAMNGRICVWTPPPPPPNDECATAIVLPVLQNCFMQTFTNTVATNSPQSPNPTCGSFSSSSGMDVWFTFTTPPSGQVIIDTQAGTLTNAAMQLYTGACGSLGTVVCSTDGAGGNMPRIDRLCTPLSPNTTYRLRVWGASGATGTFGICVSGPEFFSPRQEDCVGGATLCNSQSIVNNASGNGCSQDLNSGNRGCLNSNERQGSWYFFSPTQAGTLEFTITPTDANGNPANADYDFAIWGPMNFVSCPPSGAPSRCSYASPTNGGSGQTGAGTYQTGLAAGNTDTSEGAYNGSVNGFVAPITVPLVDVGRVFILYVDNFSQNGQSFQLDWTLTNGASLDCNVLPVELMSFEAETARDHVALLWTTQTEQASSHFVVERSADASHFTPIGTVPAAGHSLSTINYHWADEDPMQGLAYYRLRQVDLDGETKFSDMVPVAYQGPRPTLVLYPNPAQDRIAVELPPQTSGSAVLQLYDASGRLVLQRSHSVDYDGPHLQLPLHGLDGGSYVLHLITGDGRVAAVGRFIKA